MEQDMADNPLIASLETTADEISDGAAIAPKVADTYPSFARDLWGYKPEAA